MKLATLKHHGQAALIQQDRLYIISSALQRHGLPVPEVATLTMLDLLSDLRRNLDLLIKLGEHLGSDEHYQLLAEAELAAPVPRPGKMLFAGANYYSHIRQFGQAGGQAPMPPFGQARGQTFEKSKMAPYLFSKLPDSVIGPYDSLVLPGRYEPVDWELELGLVIGQEGRALSAERALDHVAGFVVINDITARDRSRRQDWPMLGSDWFLSKSTDTFCPMGPYLVPRELAGDHHEPPGATVGEWPGLPGLQHLRHDLPAGGVDRVGLRGEHAAAWRCALDRLWSGKRDDERALAPGRRCHRSGDRGSGAAENARGS